MYIGGGGCQPFESIQTENLISSGNLFPANGVIFVEDNLWIDGQIDDAQLTMAAARIGATPSQEKSIIVNNDLIYTNYDGTDKLGLIAQRNISVGLYSEDDLRIDAAVIAQNGRVGRNYYNEGCSSTYWQRRTITVFGALTTNQRYGFAWICGSTWTWGDSCDSGYETRNIEYDQNLSLVPPPFFPTVGDYTILDWRER